MADATTREIDGACPLLVHTTSSTTSRTAWEFAAAVASTHRDVLLAKIYSDFAAKQQRERERTTTSASAAPSSSSSSSLDPRSYSASLERATRSLPSEQQHFNEQLQAPNVWETVMPTDVVDDAKAFFELSELSKAFFCLKRSVDGRHHQRLKTSQQQGGTHAPLRFFALRSRGSGGMGGVTSDITWISVDDQHTYHTFEGLFRRVVEAAKLEDGDGPLAAHVRPAKRLRLFSAYYVVRSRCSQPFFHYDYPEEVGLNALTLMTPLSDFKERDSFQLLYHKAAVESPFQPLGDGTAPPARYAYKKGRAIIFGGRFRHSTEPGAAHEDDGVHAYLCFTFGTDRDEHWPTIYRTIGGEQSRVTCTTDGRLVLTRLGEELEIELDAREVRET